MGTVTFTNIVKTFSNPKETPVKILKGINLEIQSGEFVVLVGPSGCGKSTLLKCLVGLHTVTEGSIYIDGENVTELQPSKRNIALVFQSYALYPHMTVAQNMGFALKMAKVSPDVIKEKVLEVAGLLGLEELLHRFPKELSGGQRQRVAIGRSIVRRPKVFCFDEPLSNLDANLRNQLRLELKKLHHKLQTTMIYVTHDQVEAMTLADRIVVLNGGHVQQVGTPDELYNNPCNTFVAGFIGSPSMNFLHNLEEGVVIGVRPFQVQLGQGDLEAQVVAIERLGFESLVHLESNGESICARVNKSHRNYQVGESVNVGFTNVLKFEPDSGKRIGYLAGK